MGETEIATRQGQMGISVTYEVLAEGFARLPDVVCLDDLKKTANLISYVGFDSFSPTDELEQRYFDRVFVSSSPYFVPLSEVSIRHARIDGSHISFGLSAGAETDHVLRCYETAGFDYKRIKGFDITVETLKPDSLICELSFMSHLHRGSAQDVRNGNVYDRLALNFLETHLCTWAGKAALILGRTEDDFYARLCSLAAAFSDADKGYLKGKSLA